MFVDSIDIVMKIAVMIYEDGRKLKCVMKIAIKVVLIGAPCR